VGALGFVTACALATLPFALAGNGIYLWKVLTSSVDSQPRLALGANNFWWLMHGSEAKQIWDGYRWAEALSYKESGLLALSGFALAALLVAGLSSNRASHRTKRRGSMARADSSSQSAEARTTTTRPPDDALRLYWLAFFLGFVFYMVPTQMHERYLLYAFPALLLACVESMKRGGLGARAALVLYVALSVLSFITISANLAAVYPQNVPWLALHSLGGVETRVTAAIQVALFLLLLAWSWRRVATGWLVVALPAALLALGFAARFVEFREQGLPLSEVPPMAVRQLWGTMKMNTAPSGAPLASAGRTFSRGLGTVAPSGIVYRLEGRYERLTAYAGLEDQGPGAPVRIAVLGDRAPKFDAVLEIGSDLARIEVDLRGVDELILAAEPTDPGGAQTNASVQWIDPRLFH
jgi:hypothetical protein